MVYIKKWPQFQLQCLELYQKAPDKTRYLIKATPSQTWLILKVTDDVTCLKYKTRSSIILNRFESFTKDMMASMAGLPLPSASTIPTAIQNEDVEMKDGDKLASAAKVPAEKASATTPSASATTGSGGGGANKKKKKKGGKK